MKEKGFLLTLGLLMSSQICFAMENKLMASQKPPMAPPSTSAIENEREVDRGFVFGEFLYLQPFVDGLEYGFSQKHSVDLSIPTAFVKAKVQDLDFEWSPAFRIGAGYLSPTNWDLSVEWTRLTSHANGSFKTANYPDQFLSAQWLSSSVGGKADQAHAKWNLKFNTVDLLIGKDFSIGKSFSLHPFIGLRAAWIDQHYKINYHSQYEFIGLNGSSGGNLPFNSKVRIKQEFAAGGIRGGSDFIWNFVSDWSLYGNFSASLLFGHYDYKVSVLSAVLTTFFPSPTSPSLVNFDGSLTDKYNRVRSSFQEDIGIQWARWFGKYQLLVRVGYELSQWIDQNDFVNVLSSVDTEPLNGQIINDISSDSLEHQGKNLMFQGITARIEFTF